MPWKHPLTLQSRDQPLRRTRRDRNLFVFQLREFDDLIHRDRESLAAGAMVKLAIAIVFFTIVLAGIIAGSAIVLTFGHFE